ncbi:MAG: hypothetical protein ACRD21_15295, partial [Vicinamibacteria bacterium]
VSVDDVLRVAKTHVHPDKLVVLAVGREEDFDAPLSTLGEVRAIDISIPPPPSAETPPAGAGDAARGSEVLKRFVASAGDAATGLTGFSIEGESDVETPQGKLPARFHVFFAGPDRYRESTVLPFGEVVTVVKGDEAWASTPRGVRDLDADQKRRARESLYRHYLGLLWAAANGRLTAEWLPSEEVLLEAEGLRLRGKFDSRTGRLLSLTLPGTSLEGAPVEERREFAGFETGPYPTEVRIFHDGKPAAETHIGKVTLNPGEAPELWVRP